MCFNPRTRAGCDPHAHAVPVCGRQFQSTHPRGVRRGVCVGSAEPVRFQSTHPRGVRRPDPRRRGPVTHVSIHAPARGATLTMSSVHEPETFQSTHPRGVRLAGVRRTRRAHQVSIHAPARGATAVASPWATSRQGFNPRTRAGCDPHASRRCGASRGFNPRTRAGCDGRHQAQVQDQAKVSIHAPARGATGKTANIVFSIWFQSTHPRGVRHAHDPIDVADNAVSIHAPARGATCSRPSPRRASTRFNPRTRAGCDPQVAQGPVRSEHVSIHAPARGATGG